MSSPTLLFVSHTRRSCRLHRGFLPHFGRNFRAAFPPLQRAFALVMALLLLPIWQEALWAQQQSTVPQLGQPQQDYSGQLQSDQAGYPAQPYQGADTNTSQADGQPAQQLGGEQLQQLVAPIALYPDRLVALMLTASAYPAQIVDADVWLREQGSAAPEQIVAGVDAQSWDPSVKALTAFPQVLAQMAHNLPWTGGLGYAYYNQRPQMLEAVQVLRSRAQTAGNLQTNAQEAVNYVGGNIELVPVNPQVVYVPIYNPWTAYGQPVSPYPGFSLFGTLGSFLNSSAVNWGLGIAMSAFSHTPWGWLAWGLSWLAQAVLFNNSNYDSSGGAVAGGGYSYGGGGAPGYSGGGYSYSGYGGYNQDFGHGLGSYPANGNGYLGNRYGMNRSQGYFVHRPPTSAASSIARPPANESRPGSYGTAGGNNNSPAHNVPRPPNRSSGSGAPESASRNYPGGSYAGGSRQNSPLPVVHRPPSVGGAYSARLQRPSFAPSSSANFGHGSNAGSSFKQPKSAGFHPFGGGHGSQGFKAPKAASFHAPKQSFHAPKMKAPKSYGGHSGGGHSGGHSGGGHHH